MSAAIDEVSDAFEASSRGDFIQPVRTSLPDGSTLVMVAKKRQPVGTVVKVLTIRPDNPERSLPTIHATVLWIDDDSGQLLALLDGTAVTALRTGAASGAATRRLASPNAKVLGMLGAGAQAPDQIRAVLSVRPISEVRIASRTNQSAHALARALSLEIGSAKFIPVDTWGDAVRGSDIICCATPSATPLIDAADLGPRVHINAVGAYTAAMAELAPNVLALATTIAVDETEAALTEAGDIIQALDRHAIEMEQLIELGALLSDSSGPAPAGVTIFKSVGIAAQDWAVAHYALKQLTTPDDRSS